MTSFLKNLWNNNRVQKKIMNLKTTAMLYIGDDCNFPPQTMQHFPILLFFCVCVCVCISRFQIIKYFLCFYICLCWLYANTTKRDKNCNLIAFPPVSAAVFDIFFYGISCLVSTFVCVLFYYHLNKEFCWWQIICIESDVFVSFC